MLRGAVWSSRLGCLGVLLAAGGASAEPKLL
jgi:hypothetical protein